MAAGLSKLATRIYDEEEEESALTDGSTLLQGSTALSSQEEVMNAKYGRPVTINHDDD
jgi:hypothetical protein